jgi:hypothetical protein
MLVKGHLDRAEKESNNLATPFFPIKILLLLKYWIEIDN